MLSRLAATAVASAFLASPAFPQTAGTAPAPPTQESGPEQPPMSGQDPDPMMEMMRQMMQEMMQSAPESDREHGDRAARRGADHWRHGGMMDHHARMHGPRGVRSARMHGTGMRLAFAVADADGDGALSLAEIQDFHGRIFNAIDADKDGGVRMEEIDAFFHGADDESDR